MFNKTQNCVLYGDLCPESVQCSYMPSANGTCQCDEGFTYIQGRCKALSPLNGVYEETKGCKFGSDRKSVVCKNGKCICYEQYYQNSKKNYRQKSMEIGEPCIVESDCDNIKNAQKSANCEKCECIETKRKYSNQSTNKEIAVQTSFDVNIDIENDSSRSSKSDRKPFQYDEEDNIELSTLSPISDIEAKKYGEPHSKFGNPYESSRHSMCVGNICACKLGYYHRKGVCMAELGERAENENLCHTRESFSPEYRNSICVCPINWHYNSNLQSCKKPIKLLESCALNTQCASSFGTGYCDTNSIPKKCVCHSYANLNETHQLYELKTGIGSYCKEHTDCSNRVRHSICSTEKLCKCKLRFIEKNDICLPSEYMTNDNCLIGNSNSVTSSLTTPTTTTTTLNTKTESNASNSCQCKKGFVHFEESVLKEGYEDECSTNEQSRPLLGDLGKCEENKCDCDPNNHLSNGQCELHKNIGEGHTPEKSEDVKCQLGYTHDPINHICIRSRPNKSSKGPNILNIITFILIGCALFVTIAAIKQAYYA